MAIDTRAKRVSSLGDWQPLPFPDGVIDQGDRQATAWVYSGILAVAARSDDEGGGRSRPRLVRKRLPRAARDEDDAIVVIVAAFL